MTERKFFSKLLFGCPTAIFGPLLRGQPHSPNVTDCALHFRPEGHQEPRNEEAVFNFELRNIFFAFLVEYGLVNLGLIIKR